MKALVARFTGKHHEEDPINIHVTVFWATIAFWAVALACFAVMQTLD